MSVTERPEEPSCINIEQDVASPCIKACKINAETALCSGCSRTLDEIVIWSKASNTMKRSILALIEERKRGEI